ncbi:MAG TPA: universal stress protein [Ignavibacteria bacterium]|jgi:nucleotide-binding universal stress UspA family protein
MKTILVPVDFSENSAYGAEFAAIIAKKIKAKIHLLNVIVRIDYFVPAEPMLYTPPATLLIENTDKKLRETSLKALEKFSQRKIFEGVKVIFESVITVLGIHDEIINYASEVKADLIVISSKGASGLKKILIGSTAERVVRFSDRPVVVIPEKIKKTDFNILVFASDFTKEAYGIFPFVQLFAKVIGAEIHLLKINTMEQFKTTEENMKMLEDFNKHFRTKYKAVIYDDYMKEEGILHYSEKVNANMIAIGTHGKKGIARFFASDISGGMVRLTHKPVLIVNLKKYKSKADVR